MILVACKTDLRDKAVANGTFSPDRYIDRETVSRQPLDKLAAPGLML